MGPYSIIQVFTKSVQFGSTYHGKKLYKLARRIKVLSPLVGTELHAPAPSAGAPPLEQVELHAHIPSRRSEVFVISAPAGERPGQPFQALVNAVSRCSTR